jgi:hypothetical protein
VSFRKNTAAAAAQVKESEAILLGLRQEVGMLKKAIKDAAIADKAARLTGAKYAHLLSVDDCVGDKVCMCYRSPAVALTTTNLFESSSQIFRAADVEVDSMMLRPERLTLLSRTGGSKEDLSAFQQWQVKHFKYSLHTPAASEFHDIDGVNISTLLRSISRNAQRPDINFEDLFSSPTRTNTHANAQLSRSTSPRHSHTRTHRSPSSRHTHVHRQSGAASRSPSPTEQSDGMDPNNFNIRRLTVSRAGKLKPKLLSTYQYNLAHSFPGLGNTDGNSTDGNSNGVMAEPSVSSSIGVLSAFLNEHAPGTSDMIATTDHYAKPRNASVAGTKHSVNFAEQSPQSRPQNQSRVQLQAEPARTPTNAPLNPVQAPISRQVSKAALSGSAGSDAPSPLRRGNSTVVQLRTQASSRTLN